MRSAGQLKELDGERGFTLIEMLSALVIMGIVFSMAVQVMSTQSRVYAGDVRRVETEQAARTAMNFIEREIRQAKAVTSLQPGVLLITRNNNDQIKFFVADKDYNGIKDLYLQKNGTSNPVVSYIEDVSFHEQQRGTWQVVVSARQGEVVDKWQLIIRQRSV